MINNFEEKNLLEKHLKVDGDNNIRSWLISLNWSHA